MTTREVIHERIDLRIGHVFMARHIGSWNSEFDSAGEMDT